MDILGLSFIRYHLNRKMRFLYIMDGGFHVLAQSDNTGRLARKISLLSKECFDIFDGLAKQMRSRYFGSLISSGTFCKDKDYINDRISTQAGRTDLIWTCIDAYNRDGITVTLSQFQAELIEEAYWHLFDQIDPSLVFHLHEIIEGMTIDAWQGNCMCQLPGFNHYVMSQGKQSFERYLDIQLLPWHEAKWKLKDFMCDYGEVGGGDLKKWFEAFNEDIAGGIPDVAYYTPRKEAGFGYNINPPFKFENEYLRELQNAVESQDNCRSLNETLFSSNYSLEQADEYWGITHADTEANFQALKDHYAQLETWKHTPCLLPTLFSRDGFWELGRFWDDDERRDIAAKRKQWRVLMRERMTIPTHERKRWYAWVYRKLTKPLTDNRDEGDYVDFDPYHLDLLRRQYQYHLQKRL